MQSSCGDRLIARYSVGLHGKNLNERYVVSGYNVLAQLWLSLGVNF
jgi:hypothetical protein